MVVVVGGGWLVDVEAVVVIVAETYREIDVSSTFNV